MKVTDLRVLLNVVKDAGRSIESAETSALREVLSNVQLFTSGAESHV